MSKIAQAKEYMKSKFKQPTVAFAIGFVLASLLFVLVIYFTKAKIPGIYEPFQNSGYQKELHLFSNLNKEDQQEYLAMSKDEKIAKYGKELI